MLTVNMSRRLLQWYDKTVKRRRTFKYWSELQASQWLSQGELEVLQLQRLRELVTYAWTHCPHYQRTWSQLGLTPARLQSLQDFAEWPLIDRETIRAHRQQLRSTEPGLKTLAKSTGGSTGEPLHFDLCETSQERRTAASYRGYEWAGGAPGTRQFYLWGVPLGKQSWRKQTKDGLYNLIHRRHVFSTFELSRSTFQEAARQLARCRPDVIVAYTNSLYFFAGMLEEAGIRPYSPHAIIVGAEKLHAFQRQKIERVFQSPVFETYGSREFMLIGAECPHHSGLHLTMENHVVEVVDDHGLPTPAGEEGNVVITDLTNHGLPFIRYLNGDRAIAGWTTCKCGRGLAQMQQVVGRRADMIVTSDGRCLTGLFFPHLFKDYQQVERFQVVQEDIDRLLVRLVVRPEWSVADQRALAQRLAIALGPRIEIELEQVDELPLSPQGKHRVVISTLSQAAVENALQTEWAGAAE